MESKNDVKVHVPSSTNERNTLQQELTPRPQTRRTASGFHLNIPEWRSCCFNVDKRVLLFSVQVMISTGILVFCIHQVIKAKDCCESSTYMSMISGLVGYWLPQPSMH